MQNYFHYFTQAIDHIQLPEKFTFPFYYEPHPLALIATQELQDYLKIQTDIEHDFGLDKSDDPTAWGKMFGVLVVRNAQNELGYLAAVSGKLGPNNIHKKLVPPVYDILNKGSYFIQEGEVLNEMNRRIEELENNPEYLALVKETAAKEEEANLAIQSSRTAMKVAKKNRDRQRKEAKTTVSTEAYQLLEDQLRKESIRLNYMFKDTRRQWQENLETIQKKLAVFTNEINQLKQERKTRSAALQQYLFKQYKFLNAKKKSKHLIDLFEQTAKQNMPAGAGECAAPKLLQYAFLNDLEPITMAEFWWGKSPKKEIRKHQHFYPACQGKCKPILTHMLSETVMDPNPLLIVPNLVEPLEIVFEDEDLVIINKPPEFLSVPGISIKDSVYTRIQEQITDISGPIIVHRLDMSTSGLLLLAKNKEAHKAMQRQFIKKTIQKRYVALLDGWVEEDQGKISLPLRVDLDDRPRQLVCYEHGKAAETHWKVVERKEGKTRIHFYPITGRTHQLRVHASHTSGLNTAIIGDDLYGKKANRLHLHADRLTFVHPKTKKKMTVHKNPDF